MLRPWFVSFAGILLALASSRPASAAGTIQVTCAAASLVTAMNDANTSGGATTLVLTPKCVYTLTLASASAPGDGATGLPPVTADITVDGQGATITRSTAGGTPAFRIFAVDSGSLTLLDLTVSGGLASGATLGADGRGGCIFSATSLSLSGVTVTGCSAVGGDSPAGPPTPGAGLGGGIYIGAGTAAVVNSTISGNSASGGAPGGDSAGAGIYELNGAVTLTSVTIAGGTAAHGAGIFAAQGMFSVANSILSDSTTDDCDVGTGTVLSGGYNLVRVPGNCANFTAATHDMSNANPMLGVLKDNGGPTFTHAVTPTSPVFERGRCSQTVDQRGVRRLRQPLTCEIGAYEVTRSVLHILFQGTGHGTVTSQSGSVICSADCDTIELQNSSEDLTATPDTGSTFVGWMDACAGTGGCTVFFQNDQSDQTVIVNFGAVAPTPDAPPAIADAPTGGPDAATGMADAGTIGGAPDAATGAVDASTGGTIDAPTVTPDASVIGDGPIAADAPSGDAAVRDAAVNDARLADARPVDAGGGGNQDGPGILPLDRGCGCHVGNDPAEAPSLLLLVGLTGFLARRRKKSR